MHDSPPVPPPLPPSELAPMPPEWAPAVAAAGPLMPPQALAPDMASAWPPALALMALLQVDADSIARALGIGLELERSSPPMQYYIGRFTQGPFTEADFRLNTERGNAFLVLRGAHLQTGLVPGLAFAGFDFHVPGGPHPLQQRKVDAPPGRSGPLSVVMSHNASSGHDALSFDWAPLAGDVPPPLTDANAAVPGRYSLVLARAEDGQWLPAPPLSLSPHQAVNLALMGLEAWPWLAQPAVQRVRVVLDLLAREPHLPAGAGHVRISISARVVWAAPLPR